MSSDLSFNCGCSFKVLEKTKEFPKIEFSPNVEILNLDCSSTWDLISSGNTKGCFQLESRLGQMMSKKLKPQNMEQLSALISILRPGCLEAVRDGKTVSNHYIDKKNAQESIDYFHPALEQILTTTYGEMIYQEQAMEITQVVAGFNLQEADMLRKAIGKKKPEEMAKVKIKFIEGSKRLGIVTEPQAEEIFGWIEKSQRYSFNKSHSVSYAMNAYLSAYAKAHFPQIFFASYLKFAKDKIDPQQEIKELVKNANEMDIEVRLPDIRLRNGSFVIQNQHIYFGLTNIKGIGQSVYSKLEGLIEHMKIAEMSWVELAASVLTKINSTAAKALISSGALDFTKLNRTNMLFELDILSQLTSKEIDYLMGMIIEGKKPSINEIMRSLISHPKINKNRKQIIIGLVDALLSPPYSLVDKIEWLSDSENDLLGVAISCSKLDSYDIGMANTICKDFKRSMARTHNVIIAGEITNVNIVTTKNGKNPGSEMAFVSIEDQTGILDSIIFFPEQLSTYKTHLFPSNILVFMGTQSKTKDGLIVEKCFVPMT